jgi:hypothetical protein
MRLFASITGSGAAIVVAALAFLLLTHHSRLPAVAHPWAKRAIIVLAFSAGSALTITWLGQQARTLLGMVVGWGSASADTGTAYALAVAAVLVATAFTAVCIVFEPAPEAAVAAFILPVLLAIPAGGILHSLSTQVAAPAGAWAAAIMTWIAG